MIMPKYSILIYWSDEDECYLAEVPELAGCMAHGDTPEDAAREIQTAMELWLECAIEDGDEIPEPKGRLMYA